MNALPKTKNRNKAYLNKHFTNLERQFSDRIPHLSNNEFQVDIENAKRPNVRWFQSLKEEYTNLLLYKAFSPVDRTYSDVLPWKWQFDSLKFGSSYFSIVRLLKITLDISYIEGKMRRSGVNFFLCEAQTKVTIARVLSLFHLMVIWKNDLWPPPLPS